MLKYQSSLRKTGLRDDSTKADSVDPQKTVLDPENDCMNPPTVAKQINNISDSSQDQKFTENLDLNMIAVVNIDDKDEIEARSSSASLCKSVDENMESPDSVRS